MLAQACVTLCALEGVDPGDVEGGTFLHDPAGHTFAFLPGLVRTPSEGFERLCQLHLGPAMEQQERMYQRLNLDRPFRCEVELQAGQLRFLDEQDSLLSSARISLLGSFSENSRSWAWAWGNTTLPPALQEPSRRLCDEFPHRDLWEISTPQFCTDLGTAQALVAILTREAGAEGFHRLTQDHRSIFVLLHDLHRSG